MTDDRQCFYCGATVGDLQADHFPVPKRNGGETTVWCCDVCHKMKDTITFKNWSADWLGAVIADFPKMGRETRLLLAKVMQVASDFDD